MNVGILGLGLIGGSLARAYAKAGYTVYVCEKDENMLTFAQLAGVVADRLDENNIGSCDLILLAVYPAGCIEWLKKNAHLIKKDTLVMDCCGVKQEVITACFPIAEAHGFTFVGGHPMAGTHNSGFKYSRSNLFQGAPMVLVPPRFDDMQLLDDIKTALAPCGFGAFSVTTAVEHDRMIAFTSQMPHILSNAFIKSPTAKSHKGFSAGSYKDLTRVARLNPRMWAELFLENREFVLQELDAFLSSMAQYRDAIAQGDMDALVQLLDEGRQAKEEADA